MVGSPFAQVKCMRHSTIMLQETMQGLENPAPPKEAIRLVRD
jgi:hypothetical protein